MGLRPLEQSAWLEVDEHRDAELALKNDLIERTRDVVVATTPAGDAPSEELLALVLENLAVFHPAVPRSLRAGEPAIVQASLLVQEDLCLLVRDRQWLLASACVCFPSRWSLTSKIGTSLDAIHSPVPGYEEELAGPTNAFFDRLGPDRSFWRLNWTLLNDPALHQPTVRDRAYESVEQWYFRVERQTLRKLPETGAVVFTIRTYVASLQELRDRDSAIMKNLLFALDSAPLATIRYKGWEGVADRLRVALGEGPTSA
jgi:hypothetical protein